jgi:energy-coupling factor transport system substrate-specific component
MDVKNTTAAPMRQRTKPSRWSTRELVVTAIIGATFGVLLIPFTYTYTAAQAGGALGRAAAGGLFFLPASFTVYAIRKPGAVLLVGLISGLFSAPFTPFGLVVIVISMLTAVMTEPVAWLTTGYRRFSVPRMGLLGLMIGLLEFLLIAATARTTRLEPVVFVPALVVSGLAFVAASVAGKLLADAVARTGVLANINVKRSIEGT